MLPGAGCSREGEAGLQRARQGGIFFFFPGPCTRESILKLCPCRSEKCFRLGKMEEGLWSRNGALTVSLQGARLIIQESTLYMGWKLCFVFQYTAPWIWQKHIGCPQNQCLIMVGATRGRWRRWLKRVILVSCWGQTIPALPTSATSSLFCFRVLNTCSGAETDECDQQVLCPFSLLLSFLLFFPTSLLPPPELPLPGLPLPTSLLPKLHPPSWGTRQ